jgi:hypothetical protein
MKPPPSAPRKLQLAKETVRLLVVTPPGIRPITFEHSCRPPCSSVCPN